jgi:hypothetical protein
MFIVTAILYNFSKWKNNLEEQQYYLNTANSQEFSKTSGLSSQAL